MKYVSTAKLFYPHIFHYYMPFASLGLLPNLSYLVLIYIQRRAFHNQGMQAFTGGRGELKGAKIKANRLNH